VADGVSDGLPWAVPDRDRNQTHLRHNDAATGRPGRPAPGIGAARDCTQVTAIAHLRGTGSLREPSEVVALKVGGSSPLGHPRSERCRCARPTSRVLRGQLRATTARSGPRRRGFRLRSGLTSSSDPAPSSGWARLLSSSMMSMMLPPSSQTLLAYGSKSCPFSCFGRVTCARLGGCAPSVGEAGVPTRGRLPARGSSSPRPTATGISTPSGPTYSSNAAMARPSRCL
jgi:hypothetical protein